MERNKQKETIVEVISNGPLKISGNIKLTDSVRGITSEDNEIYLCRCGKSGNKPYCDGSHKRHQGM
jgi:CDGSH iron-sulfur domain-containing protein 3